MGSYYHPAPFRLRTITSALPSIPAAEYHERQGGSETGQCRPSMVRSGDPGSIARTNNPTLHSIQEALRMYLQPIKHDDPQLDFYTMYKRETMEYDAEYIQKHNEDLNTTLIFVGFRAPSSMYSVDHVLKPVCSPPSAPPSSSTSSPTSSLIPTNNRRPTSAQSSSASTHPSLLTKIPPSLRPGMVLPRRSSQPWTFCTQAFSCRCWPHSSRCWANSG